MKFLGESSSLEDNLPKIYIISSIIHITEEGVPPLELSLGDHLLKIYITNLIKIYMDKRSKSFAEVNCNLWIGLVINYCINLFIFYVAGQSTVDIIKYATMVSVIAIICSYIRLYLIRRYFEGKPENWAPWSKIWNK